MAPPLVVRHLGLADYLPTLEAMRHLTAERDEHRDDGDGSHECREPLGPERIGGGPEDFQKHDELRRSET